MKITIEHGYYCDGRIRYETPRNEQRRIHGIERVWHDNGRLQREVPYLLGQQHGTEKHWHRNGQDRLEVSYRNDFRYGLSRMWDEHGKLIYEKCYLRSKEVTEEEYEATLKSKT